MRKDVLESSPQKGIQRYCQRNIQRDVLFAENVVLCYRCKSRHMLGENCPVVITTNDDCGMSLNEQSVLFHRIKVLHNLILLQRFFLALNPCNNLQLRQGMWLGETILRNLLIQIQSLCQNWGHAVILVHTVSLALNQ